MRAGHVGEEKASRRGHAQAAGLDRDPDARAVRRAAQSRRQADDGRAARRGRRAPPTCWFRPSPTTSPPTSLNQPDCKLKLIANFGNGVDNIDVDGRACARHHRHQHAEGSDRRHRRHDHGADPGGAAPADRRRLDPDRGQALAGLVADLDARPPHRRQAARHHRHGPHRPGGGAPRPRLRPADPLPQPPPGGAEDRRRAWARPIGKASTRCWRGWTSSR